ncbi:unnamed protein product [Sphenostylis stenocarpa]|uniref:Uncharacterized protein n=1 Tax=Sphenostylis stenocarpa TaxID=92480 RepID=A0AA86TDF7_9FABA|nr:unnamed protein product [Sphenostylis stenocarpa]
MEEGLQFLLSNDYVKTRKMDSAEEYATRDKQERKGYNVFCYGTYWTKSESFIREGQSNRVCEWDIVFLVFGLTVVSYVQSAHPAQPFVSIENVSQLHNVCFTHTRVQTVVKLSLGSE